MPKWKAVLCQEVAERSQESLSAQRKMSGAASEDRGTRETGRGCFMLMALSLRPTCCSCSWFLRDNLISLQRHLKPFLARVSFKWDSLPHKFCNMSKWPRLWRWELGHEGESVIGLFVKKTSWEFSGPFCYFSRFTGILKWGLYCRRSWYLPISHSFCIFRVTSWWCSRKERGWSIAAQLSLSMTCLGPVWAV